MLDPFPRRNWAVAALLATFLLRGCDGAKPPGGPFTLAQVTAGHASYQAYCAGCHGNMLQGGGLQGGSDAPPLTGPVFRNDWAKYPIQVFYRFVSKAMPAGLEGDLSPRTYANVISFLLAANGAKAGPSPLDPNSKIRIGDIAGGQMVPAVVNAPVAAQP